MTRTDRTRPTIAPRPTRNAAALLAERFGDVVTVREATHAPPAVWTDAASVREVLAWLRDGCEPPFALFYDLYAVDERTRRHRTGPPRDFTVVYHLLALDGEEDVRVMVPVSDDHPEVPSLTPIWPVANWYECEAWDMFGIRFAGHPHLRRILMPPTWEGHPLRKDHPARATELGTFDLPPDRQERELAALQFRPEEWGLARANGDTDFLFLNVGPQHPGTHGVLRVVLQLAGERIVDAVPDIGYHHRGAEKMAERQSWHTFIPYTDRIDYLGGVLNNLPYVMAVEQLADITVPDRARVIRIMLCELFRLASHLVWYGTFAQDVGQMSPVFYMFTDRERVLEVIEAICGDRMHPNWFRIGGVAQDLPRGWRERVQVVLDTLPRHLDTYETIVMRNAIFRDRTVGVGAYDTATALAWGVTGPGLRATGRRWDLRKRRPYGGYDQFDFEVPTASAGDCYARAEVRIAEMRQSLRIVEQCLHDLPPGPVQADHPLATPPRKARTMEDIETLIHHFLGVSWGPVVPPGESYVGVEASKGLNGYTLISDGDVRPYRARIRTPSFPHLQMLPEITRGLLVPDLLAILGSIDFVLADVDR